jgi:hypothetical protein
MHVFLDVFRQDPELAIGDQRMVNQSRKHRIIEKLSSPGAELSFPSWSLHRNSPAGLVRAPRLTQIGDCAGRQNQQNAAGERSCFFVRPRTGVNFIGFADNSENPRARAAEWKCKRKETAGNLLFVPDVLKNLIGRRIRLATRNPSRCAGNFVVFEDFTQGFIRLILEKFAPAFKLGE